MAMAYAHNKTLEGFDPLTYLSILGFQYKVCDDGTVLGVNQYDNTFVRLPQHRRFLLQTTVYNGKVNSRDVHHLYADILRLAHEQNLILVPLDTCRLQSDGVYCLASNAGLEWWK